MIVSGKSISSVMKVYGEQNQITKNANTNKNQVKQGKDEFILSSGAQEFGQIFNSIIGLPEVRQEKVNEISAKIDAGTYEVDSKGVATKMLGGYLG